MTFGFTPTGFQIDTFDELLDELVLAYKAIYGSNINLESDSPDGQRVAIDAKAQLDLESFLLWLYNSFDPDFAMGVQLTRIGKFSGLTPRPATQSTWAISVTSDRVQTLAVGYTIKDDIDQQWELTAEAVLIIGANALTFTAVGFGAVTGLIGAVFSQVTFINGITIADATVDATVGIEEETAEAFRRRRAKSTENPAFSTLGSLFSKLADFFTTPGVTDVVVYENDTDVNDAVRDILPHTIWCVVEGGTDAAIVETIAKNKTGGAGTKGTESADFVETVIRPNGSTFTITHTMEFDRPTDVPVFITVDATRTVVGESVDIALIATKLAEFIFNIGGTLQAGELYEVALTAGTNFFLTNLLISNDDILFVDGELFAGFDGKHSLIVANIDVTEIIP